jgi:flagellar protein FliJ
MKGLPNLIRLHRWRLDEKRRDLAELERLADDLKNRARNLEEEIRSEQNTAKGSTEAAFGYANYAQAAIARRAKIAATMAEVKSQIAAAAAEVTAQFQELKRLEIAQTHREQAERQRMAKAEQAMYDELGLSSHQRRNGGA